MGERPTYYDYVVWNRESTEKHGSKQSGWSPKDAAERYCEIYLDSQDDGDEFVLFVRCPDGTLEVYDGTVEVEVSYGLSKITDKADLAELLEEQGEEDTGPKYLPGQKTFPGMGE